MVGPEELFELRLLGGSGQRAAGQLAVQLDGARHQGELIAKTAANTLEGYFHPRQLAFAIGLVGLGEVLRGRPWLALAAAAGAGAGQPTTGLWFAD